MIEKIPLELYIHIPFCIRKCLYCDFLSFAAGADQQAEYVDKLLQEIEVMGIMAGAYEVVTVFFGGGTPSVLLPEQTVGIMEQLHKSFFISPGAEVTTEANPGTLDREKLKLYREAGINRLSLGLQSADGEELLRLGRIHTFGEFLDSFRLAREAGFDNINIDLMSALPGQSFQSYRHTLEQVADLEPEHISAYSLIVEEGTPFYCMYGEEAVQPDGGPGLPDEDTEREMYHFTKQFLKARGYDRYEVSNYAAAGKICRHNEGYWRGTEYLGLGLGAASLLKGERFSVTRDMEQYLSMSRADLERRKHHEDVEVLTLKSRMEEFMFLGLRMTEGISAAEFEERFGKPVMSVYGEAIEGFLEQGLMERRQRQVSGRTDIRFKLTEYGTDVSNQVLCGFLL